MAIGRTITSVDSENFDGGCNYSPDLTSLAPNESPHSMNMVFDGFRIFKRPGRTKVNSTAAAATAKGHSMFNIGVEGVGNKLVAHFGNTVYSMNNLNGTLTSIRTSTPNVRSYNAAVDQKLIQSYEDNSAEYYWDGETSTMTLLSGSAPGFKHAVEAQGYLLAGNISGESLRVYYEDISTMVGGNYDDFFTLPGSKDDELTGFMTINGRTYASTTDRIYRLSFVGGVVVWDFREIVSSTGVVPGTAKVVVSEEFGEVTLFLGYDRHMYLFDGSFVRKVDKKFYQANDITTFSLERLERHQLENASAVYDPIDDIYRLVVTLNGTTANSIMINIDVRNFAYYPFDNQPFHSLVLAQDKIGRRFVLGAGYDGHIYKLMQDVNHDDGEEIVEVYESPPITAKGSRRQKGQMMTVLFQPVGNYSLTMSDRVDFDKTWKQRALIPMFHNRDRFLGINASLGEKAVLGSDVEKIMKQINIPASFNYYRFKLETGGVAGRYVAYTTGTVAGSGGGTSITGTDTVWESYMTADNDFYIWIKDGDHKNEVYTFTYVSATSATVSTMTGTSPADDFTGASYEVFRRNYAPAGRRWELDLTEMSIDAQNIGKSEALR
jgi:hypothetical protein